MAAIMVAMCIVMLIAGHDGFMRPRDSGASNIQAPHMQTDVQRTDEGPS